MDPELNAEAHPEKSFDRADLIRIALVALVATATWFRLWQPLPRLDVIATAGGTDFFTLTTSYYCYLTFGIS